MTRTPYPHERMPWDQYIKQFSRGDTFDHKLSEDEVYELEREIYEHCLYRVGCDFEGSKLFHVKVTLLRDWQKPNWIPVPRTSMGATEEECMRELEATQHNLAVAMSEFQAAWRHLDYLRRERSNTMSDKK